jgi:uncharacterized RDD family membrane protein YckC
MKEKIQPEEIKTESTPEVKDYPGVSVRVKAIIVDAIALVAFMLLATYIFSMFKSVPDEVRIGTFIFIFFLYDPIFTSSFGGTLGHMLLGIRVKREKDPTKNIIFPLALVRYIVKAGMGWVSLITVTMNVKRKAIHDYLVKSVVINYKKK